MKKKRHAITQPLDRPYRLIPLTRGKTAIVDAADFDWLMQWTWTTMKGSYATRAGHTIPMHVQIFGSKGVDHRNRNGLDNRRSNLRAATPTQQVGNQSIRRTNTSGYKGVSWDTRDKKWRAQIQMNDKQISLGYFTTKEEAALAYDAAAKKHFGEFAVLNAPLVRWQRTGIWDTYDL